MKQRKRGSISSSQSFSNMSTGSSVPPPPHFTCRTTLASDWSKPLFSDCLRFLPGHIRSAHFALMEMQIGTETKINITRSKSLKCDLYECHLKISSSSGRFKVKCIHDFIQDVGVCCTWRLIRIPIGKHTNLRHSQR